MLRDSPVYLFLFVFVVAALVLGLIMATNWNFESESQQLADWALRNNCRLTQCKRCWYWFGPFWLTTSRAQRVYRISVVDPSGQERSGYARCGTWLFGALSEDIDFAWDE
jgi:hypothetical protein